MPPTHADHAVVARLAIEDLVARYCDAAARADEAAFRACWTADAHWTGPGLDRSGADAIVAAWATMRSRYVLALQGLLAGTVRVQDATATASWWIRELLVTHDGAARETVGRYDDEYAYGDGGWRIARRAFTPAGG